MKEVLLQTKSEKFALRIVKLSEFLENKKQKILAGQILRSGTSIGANIAESIYASSPADFINKLQIAQKEANETKFWLNLLFNADYINEELYKSFINDITELLKILGSSLKTLKLKP